MPLSLLSTLRAVHTASPLRDERAGTPARAKAGPRPWARHARLQRLRPLLLLHGLLALAALGAFVLLRARIAPLLWLFETGNVMATNEESQLLPADVLGVIGHGQVLFAAGGLLLLQLSARLLGSGRRSVARLWARAPLALLLAASGACALYAIRQRSTWFGGERYFFLQDDAMTSMIYARNWLEGKGLVYQPGERVEGYSNPLWVGVLALIHAFHPTDARAPLWVLLSSWGFVTLTALWLYDTLRAWRLGPGWGTCAALLFLADRNTWVWAVSGLETSACAAAVTACVWALARGRSWVFAVALASLCALRSDGFVLALPLAAAGVASLRGTAHGWRRARHLAPALAVLLSLFAFRYCYYGHLFPNTYYLKLIQLGDRLQTGLGGYGWRLLVQYGLFLALAAMSMLRGEQPTQRRLYACVLFQAAYAIYLGGDIFKELRFFAPVIPVLYACAAHSLEGMLRRGPLLHAVAAQALLFAACPGMLFEGRLGQLPQDGRFFQSNLAVAELFKANVPAGSLITIYPAGTVPYYAPHARYLDVFGKNDEHIAHLSHYEGKAIGHNKSDFDYVYQKRRPELAFVLLPCDTIDQYSSAPVAERRQLRARFASNDTPVRLSDIEHPIFQRDYYPNRIRYAGQPAPTPLECLFVRGDSSIPRVWSVPRALTAADSQGAAAFR